MTCFEKQPCFSVSETAEIIGVTEDSLRGWHARNPTAYMGLKAGHRVWFNAHEAYFFALVRDLTAFGVPVRTAMHNAARLADEAFESDGPIRDEVLVVRSAGEVTTLSLVSAYELPAVDGASLVIPLAAVWSQTMDRARETFARAAE